MRQRGNSALLLACRSGSIPLINWLISVQHLDVTSDVNDDGQNALMLACLGGHIDAVKWLIEVKGLVLDNSIDEVRPSSSACLLDAGSRLT